MLNFFQRLRLRNSKYIKPILNYLFLFSRCETSLTFCYTNSISVKIFLNWPRHFTERSGPKKILPVRTSKKNSVSRLSFLTTNCNSAFIINIFLVRLFNIPSQYYFPKQRIMATKNLYLMYDRLNLKNYFLSSALRAFRKFYQIFLFSIKINLEFGPFPWDTPRLNFHNPLTLRLLSNFSYCFIVRITFLLGFPKMQNFLAEYSFSCFSFKFSSKLVVFCNMSSKWKSMKIALIWILFD